MKQFMTLLRKDLKIEFRTFDILSSMGIYAVLVLVVFGVAFMLGENSYDITPLASGLLWVLAVFTSLLGLNRSFNREREFSALEALLLSPLDRGVLFLSKVTANALFLSIVFVVAVPLFVFLFLQGGVQGNGVLAPSAPLVLAPLAVGILGIAGVGTLLATITLHTRGRDIMLALLFIPVIFPLLYSCVTASSMALLGISDSMVFLQTLGMGVGYDVIMILVGWMLYDFVLNG
ncbi:MAG: heme exporter protein CcmB [Coriobacteriia bacterium]|nr:heme exporter protein CcmB [Coriobacteriia bacterium]